MLGRLVALAKAMMDLGLQLMSILNLTLLVHLVTERVQHAGQIRLQVSRLLIAYLNGYVRLR